jgi:hypothetical protein
VRRGIADFGHFPLFRPGFALYECINLLLSFAFHGYG